MLETTTDPDARTAAAPQTVVTALFDLDRRERSGRATIDYYKQHGQYVLSLRTPLVAYMEPELIEWAAQVRLRQGLAHLTTLIPRPLESLPLYNLLPEIASYRTFKNRVPDKDTPLHQIVEWSKLDMVAEAVSIDPFGTDHFAWIDFGIAHVAQAPTVFPGPSDVVAILQICSVAPDELNDPYAFYEYQRGRLAAGLIRGDKEHLLLLRDKFRTELSSRFRYRFRPNEETVLSAIGAKHPELFHFYYGHYRSVLANWQYVHHDIPTVLLNLAHSRQVGLWDNAVSIVTNVLDSVQQGTLRLRKGQRAKLLDECFVAAWHTNNSDLAHFAKSEMLEKHTRTTYFTEHRRRIKHNFSFALPMQAGSFSASSPRAGAAINDDPSARQSIALWHHDGVPAGRRGHNIGVRNQTICLCMIVRDEVPIISRCLHSVISMIDAWIICDTGSKDETISLIQDELASIPGTLYQRPWVDFGTNRSELMALARGTADYLLLVDADMTVHQKGAMPDLSADAYLLQHSGEPSYWVPRLIKADRLWRFEGSTHEYLTSDGKHSVEQLGALCIDHHGDGAHRQGKFERDRALLEDELHSNPDNTRAMFYLAQTYADLGEKALAIDLYLRRSEAGGWEEEVFYSLYRAGELMEEDDPPRASALLQRAAVARSNRAEPLYQLSRLYRQLGQYEEAYEHAKKAASVPYPAGDVLFVHPFVHQWGALFELSIAAYWVGEVEEALEVNDRLLTVPNLPASVEESVRNNRLLCESAVSSRPSWMPPITAETVPLLSSLASSLTFGEICLDVSPKWPQCNPTIARSGDGWRLLVRTVNYLMVEGQYQLLDESGVVQNLYYAVDLNSRLEIEATFPLVDLTEDQGLWPSPVQGFEDCRLFELDGAWYALATVADRSPDNRRQVALMALEGGDVVRTTVLKGPPGQFHEKNWMPFISGDRLLVVYSCSPTVVLEVDVGSGKTREVSRRGTLAAPRELRGGSQGLATRDGWLFVGHELDPRRRARRYLHRFVFLDRDFEISRVSLPFSFTGNDIEFCAGLARRDGELLVSFGTNDGHAMLGALEEDEVLDLLGPIVQ